jgi:enterochelin esterase-like enzyme
MFKRKKLLFLVCGTFIVLSFLILQTWDILFSELQHQYYSFKFRLNNTSSYESRIEKRTLESHILRDVKKRVLVYIPKEYDIDRNRRFPTLYLLHGYPGMESDWLINTNLQRRLDNKIKEGKIPPLIVVFPDMNGPILRDSQYVDATKINQQMEKYFIFELIPYIDAHYRTATMRGKRAIGGLSSGGYGALYLGIKHNDLFSYIFSHSGYMINRERVMTKLVKNYPSVNSNYNIFEIIKQERLSNPVFIYTDIGKDDDKNFIEDNNNFDRVLTRLHIPHLYHKTEGWHGWSVWNKNIDYSLDYLELLK